MSRGPGRIERAIDQIFDVSPDDTLTVEALCKRIYPAATTITKAQRVAVLRAAYKRPGLLWYRSRDDDHALVFTRNEGAMILDTVDRVLLGELTRGEYERRQRSRGH